MTVATWVCWSMTSLIQIAYRSLVRRQGRSRAERSNQASSLRVSNVRHEGTRISRFSVRRSMSPENRARVAASRRHCPRGCSVVDQRLQATNTAEIREWRSSDSPVFKKERLMAVKPVPDGYHTVTPYLIVKDAAKALDYYRK